MAVAEKDVHERLDTMADAGLVLTFGLLGLTLAEWHSLAQIAAGFAAFFAGTAAGIYHLHRWRQSRRDGD